MADEKTNGSTEGETDDLNTPEPETTAETEIVTAEAAPAAQPERRSGFLPLAFGGAVAAVLGFLGSELGLIGSKIGDLPTTVSAQEERIEALEAVEMPTFDTSAIDSLRTDVDSRFGEIEEGMAQIDASIAKIDETITATQDRITDLEERPIIKEDGGLDAQAYVNELTALKKTVEEQRTQVEEQRAQAEEQRAKFEEQRAQFEEQRAQVEEQRAQVDAQRSEIETLLNNARSVEEATAEAAKVASAQAALVRVISALDAGEPYAEPLEEVSAAGVTVPEALAAHAADGVPTLGSLQDSFPGVARTALAAARSGAEGEDKPSGLAAILKQQLGARSITPREGNDPDAVLSRAEAALRSGDLPKTLEEISALPDPAKDALGDWQALATARGDAKNAASELSQSLTTN